jgi:peroxiredoxin
MRTRILVGLTLAGLVCAAFYSRAPVARAQGGADDKPSKAVLGEKAPDFTLKDTYGKEFSLSEFKGKIVVLEWVNPDCPVSKGHHDKKTMQDTYKKHAEKIVWLGIDSSRGAKAENLRVYSAKMGIAFPILLDGDGKVGHSFGAATTPHMFVIDKDGKLAYNGAIDDKGSTNYVNDAVEALVKGETVAKPKTAPYGCGVKYASR